MILYGNIMYGNILHGNIQHGNILHGNILHDLIIMSGYDTGGRKKFKNNSIQVKKIDD